MRLEAANRFETRHHKDVLALRDRTQSRLTKPQPRLNCKPPIRPVFIQKGSVSPERDVYRLSKLRWLKQPA